MKRTTRMVTRGPAKPAGISWQNVHNELPAQQLRTTRETNVATRIAVFEELAGVLTGRRGSGGDGQAREYTEALVGSGRRFPCDQHC